MTIKVSPTQINNSATSFKGGAPKSFIIKSEGVHNFLKRAGNLSTPANRALLGATAIAIQPAIDLTNKDVDKKTREVSAARTISKIVIGTATGILVRQGCIDWMSKYTRTASDYTNEDRKILGFIKVGKATPKKWDKFLFPTHISPEQFESAMRQVKKHRQALGSIVALGVMLITNFLIDAPLTKICTNLIVKKADEASAKKLADKGGK